MNEFLQQESKRLCREFKVETIDEVLEIQEKIIGRSEDGNKNIGKVSE